MPSPPSTRPSDARERRSSAFVRERHASIDARSWPALYTSAGCVSTSAQFGGQSRPPAGAIITQSQHHHSRAHLHPAVEIDHVLVGHPDAARGNRLSDIFGLVGAVDAIQRVLAASVE